LRTRRAAPSSSPRWPADTATTAANGEPLEAVTLARIPGVAPPDSAIVEIRATRYKDNQPVPGSGPRWIIHFGL
jgi:hypothetical protein